MKLITAVVQPFMLAKLAHALEAIPRFPGMTVTDVRGFGRDKHDHAEHHPVEDVFDFVKKARIDIAATDEMVQPIISMIEKIAHTGNRGDGKIFVVDLESAVRVRTGERDAEALG